MGKSNDDRSASGTLFDWDDFQQGFFGGGAWKEAWNSGALGTIPWVDRYVKGVLADAVPAAAAAGSQAAPPAAVSKQSSLACNVFETHRALIVRIRLSADDEPRDIRLLATPNELKVAGLAGGEEKTVKLPLPVRVDGAKAICKQRIVEVTLPREEAYPVKEIPLRYMEGG